MLVFPFFSAIGFQKHYNKKTRKTQPSLAFENSKGKKVSVYKNMISFIMMKIPYCIHSAISRTFSSPEEPKYVNQLFVFRLKDNIVKSKTIPKI